MIRILLFMLIPSIVISQDVAIGQWKDYLAYNQPSDICVAKERVYCVAQGGLFYYNNDDNSINRISKINGLSDNSIKQIKYNKENERLIIAYDNCNIDILLDDQITNISDIKRKEINGIKQINNIYFKENLAYISCSFGLVVLDLIRNEVKDTYKIGYSGNYKEINQTAIINDLIYVATSEGIYYAEKENLFLSDFNQWTQDTSFNNSNFINNSFSSINNLNNTPVAIINLERDSILIKNNAWEVFSEKAFNNPNVDEKEFGLFICDSNVILILDNDFIITQIESENVISCDALINNIIWAADKKNGLLKYVDGIIDQQVDVNSPISNSIYSLEFDKNQLFICHGGHMNFSVNSLNNEGVSYLSSDEWNNVDFFDLNRARDIVAVATNSEKEFTLLVQRISVMQGNNHLIKYGYDNTGGIRHNVLFK